MITLRPTLLNSALLTPEPPNWCPEVLDVHGRNETRSKYLKEIVNRHMLPKMASTNLQSQSIQLLVWGIVDAAIIGTLLKSQKPRQ